MSNKSPPIKGMNPGAYEGQEVPASYKTPAVLLIYTCIVKSSKSLVNDRGKKKLC
jgi:hypothetical protein